MKKVIAIMLAGWMGWIDTTKWDEVSYLDRKSQKTTQESTRAPKSELRDILLGPRAKTWREVKGENREPQRPLRSYRVDCNEGTPGDRC